MRHGFVATIALAACIPLAGCASDPTRGYSFEPTMGVGTRSVAVPVFENSTQRTGLEVRLTEAVIKELQRRGRMDVTGAGPADTLLTGTIRTVEYRQITRDSFAGLTDEQAVRITVDFSWKDSRTGRVLVSRTNFSAVDTFVPARGTGERPEIGERGTLAQLARDIVGEMRSAW